MRLLQGQHMVWAPALLVLLCIGCISALDNGLGRTPPLGFNTWNYFGCDINESVVRSSADRLISLGLAEAGYRYLNIDDCWHLHSRSSSGQLQADPFKFPSGMKALADELHAKGLLFGIYADSGLLTCAGFPGSRFHEADDARLFAEWGVDYLKYDNCFAPAGNVQQRYHAMRDALNNTGRHIYFSMCEWGVNSPWLWGQSVGNSWRIDADIDPSWSSILRSLDNGAAGLARFAGPGGWNDPDMLEVGNGHLSVAQQRSHFALWALVKAPLLVGTNLETVSDTSLAILKAKEVIAINQDPLGVAGDIIWKEGPAEVWAAPLANGDRAVILFNRHWVGDPVVIGVSWAQVGLTTSAPSASPAAGPCITKAVVRDLFAEKDLGVFEHGYEALVESYDVAVLRVTPLMQPPSGASGCGGGASVFRRNSSSSSGGGGGSGSFSERPGGDEARHETLQHLLDALHWVQTWIGSYHSNILGRRIAARSVTAAHPAESQPQQPVLLANFVDKCQKQVQQPPPQQQQHNEEQRQNSRLQQRDVNSVMGSYGSAVRAVDDGWRPWHGREAGELQARYREAAAEEAVTAAREIQRRQQRRQQQRQISRQQQ